ncbi:SDR family NAD(P)-dependent oxidoreductase [Bradyrhizobium erythrophlei]|uniref:SDR family NAD(P)-dependent oxidoreductase n=1 Tax=Bradyrhizobium erythrophlei TaxID=1437360 RepID=UPI0035E6FC9C
MGEVNVKLEGKVAIVTGAAGGLGRAYVNRLASLGADIGAIDLSFDGASTGFQTSARTVADEVQSKGRRCVTFQGDLGERRAACDAIEAVIRAFGRIDVLVNNAGGAITPVERSSPSNCPEEDAFKLFGANLWSTIFCCQAAVPIMKSQSSGSIINTSSVAAHSVAPNGRLALYGAAKAAVTHYTRNLAAELGPHGIRVNCIAPGIIMTPRVKAQSQARGIGVDSELKGIPMRRFGEAEDCAGVIEFLATDLSRYVTGECISASGGALLTPH